MELADKVAIVTGGASGIGRAAAIAFAREGASVLVADIAAAGGEETVSLVREAGGIARFLRTNVTRSEDVAAMVAEAVAQFGGLDIAFNNAGSNGMAGSVVEVSEGDFEAALAINVKSVFLCMKFEIPEMIRRGGGAIVNTASGLGLAALPGRAAYVTTKHAVIGLSKAAAVDFGPSGIRVNTLAPGMTETPMLQRSAQHSGLQQTAIGHRMPLGRLGSAEEQAEAALWLCSPRASFVTGETLAVDGGTSAVR
jgi:NAD(P)-dependent dehydrogenase (short-subunit alcohol dehydrogenase family)